MQELVGFDKVQKIDMDVVTIDDLKKLDIRIGKIISAKPIEGSEKLLQLQVHFGEFERQILSGIAKFYTPEELIGKSCPFIVNLAPRQIMGLESQGMLMAVALDDKAVLLHPDKQVPEGSGVK